MCQGQTTIQSTSGDWHKALVTYFLLKASAAAIVAWRLLVAQIGTRYSETENNECKNSKSITHLTEISFSLSYLIYF